MYKINLKINEQFKCQAKLDGAFPRKLRPRLVFESGQLGFICEGTIDHLTGECRIPLTGLRQCLKEGATGNLRLEMIVGDTYYSPWADTFECVGGKNILPVAKKAPVMEHKKPGKPQAKKPIKDDLSLAGLLKNIK